MRKPDFALTANIITQVAQSAGDFRIDIAPAISNLQANVLAVIADFQQYRVKRVSVKFLNTVNVNSFDAVTNNFLQTIFDVPVFDGFVPSANTTAF